MRTHIAKSCHHWIDNFKTYDFLNFYNRGQVSSVHPTWLCFYESYGVPTFISYIFKTQIEITPYVNELQRSDKLLCYFICKGTDADINFITLIHL